jgi:formate dehydrogenase maturation protein FdhE
MAALAAEGLISNSQTNYDARIRRAQSLAELYPFAHEVLTFYARIAEFQRRLASRFPPSSTRTKAPLDATTTFRAPLDLALLVPHLPDFLSLLQRVSPTPAATVARQWASRSPASWGEALGAFWIAGSTDAPKAAGEPIEIPLRDPEAAVPDNRLAKRRTLKAAISLQDPLNDLICRALVQPYCEFVAAHSVVPPQLSESSICPLCSSLPLLGVLRPEGDGAKRHLVCSWCLHEWPFRRIFCPACGEETEQRLPVFVAEQFPHIRVEACDTCHTYIRTIDLTKDGNAIPVVDDLAAIPLSLWADEHHYRRLHPNLLIT